LQKSGYGYYSFLTRPHPVPRLGPIQDAIDYIDARRQLLNVKTNVEELQAPHGHAPGRPMARVNDYIFNIGWLPNIVIIRASALPVFFKKAGIAYNRGDKNRCKAIGVNGMDAPTRQASLCQSGDSHVERRLDR